MSAAHPDTVESVLSFLERRQLKIESIDPEQYGDKLTIRSGSHIAYVTVYNTGKILVGGKNSPLKDLLEQMRAALIAGHGLPGQMLPLELDRTPDETREEESDLKRVSIYTDGACIGNPGPGGYGVVLICEVHRRELSGGYRLTTNNRMEMMAAIVGLQSLKYRCSVRIYTDSQYLSDAITKRWLERWQSTGWKRRDGGGVLNRDLWHHLAALLEQHEAAFAWIKGHSGIEENERCDELATQAALMENLPADLGYEETLAGARAASDRRDSSRPPG